MNHRTLFFLLAALIASSLSARTYHGVSFFADGLNAWVVSTQGHILHSTDGGWNWEEQTSGTIYKIYDVHFASPLEGWTAGGLGEVLHTTDGGDTWSRQAIGLAKIYARIFFLNDNCGWAAGEAVIGRTTNGGDNWSQIFLDPYYDSTICYGVSFVDTLEGWLSGGISDSLPEQGYIFHTTSGGDTWSLQLRDTLNDFMDIFFVDSQKGWAVGGSDATYDPIILHTTDGGGSWSPQTAPGGSHYLRSIQFVSDLEGWAVGKFGTIIHTTDGGSTWESQSYPTQQTLFDLSFANPAQGIVVGDSSIILVTTNGGDDWQFVVTGVEKMPSYQLPVTGYKLHQSYPNPFTAVTSVQFSVPSGFGDQQLSLRIYDTSGRLIRNLLNGVLVTDHLPLTTAVSWDGTDNSGRQVPGGVYFYRLQARQKHGGQAGGLRATKKLLLLR